MLHGAKSIIILTMLLFSVNQKNENANSNKSFMQKLKASESRSEAVIIYPASVIHWISLCCQGIMLVQQ